MSYEIIEQFNAAQIEDLYELYQLSWWGNDRKIPDIKIMLENSDINLGICEKESKKLVGFTRILTDYIYRAIICDVMVDPNYQKQGLGSQLIKEIVNHPKLQNVGTFMLVCLPEMIPFYEKLGFTNHDRKDQFMTFDGTVSY
ncbi:MAG: GNAT family N-acetyltransferase [Crocosphaera sp.]|nr:GNAT family N-acetyltransferase [Crocosphaera sp.]